MKISFDLDDTIVANNNFAFERQTLLQRILGIERIRFGTIELFKKLRTRGHSIYIYTTSFRSESRISFMFRSYGIPVDVVINQQLHDRKFKGVTMSMSKYPPAFGIDLHVDDSRGVGIEGERYGFKTIIVSVNDSDWVNSILNEI